MEHQCVYCPKTFAHLSQLKHHKRIHTRERPFTCDRCHKAFTTTSNLKRHQRTHTGEKPYKCEECHKAFAYTFELRQHQRTHTGEKPYKCEKCQKAFTQASTLKRHDLKHTGERPYKCEECRKTFALADTLKKHQRMHTGEKPYNCEKCLKSFSQSSNLRKHHCTHTGKKLNECEARFFESLKSYSRLQARKKFNEGASTSREVMSYFCKCCHRIYKPLHFKYHRCVPVQVQHRVPMPSKCFVCGKEPINKLHLLLHDEYKPYRCANCQLEFSTVSHWQQHIMKENCNKLPWTIEEKHVSEVQGND